MPFEKIHSTRKSYQVVDQLLKMIKKGEYSKGDKLPPEKVVAEKFEVSRPLVREAYSALQLIGIIETRVGDGTYVTKDSISTTDWSSKAASILANEDDPIEVWEARQSIESGNMNLVVANVTSDDIEKIRKAFKSMEQSVQNKDYENYFEADRNFHLEIAEATHNSYLKKSVEPLIEVMKEDLWQEIKRTYFLERDGALKDSLKSHQDVFRSIKQEDPGKAVESMHLHFEELKTVFGESE